MDARLQATMAEAASAEEAAAVQQMTREEIVNAKIWEQHRLAMQNFREARSEWHRTVLDEIDFNRKLAEMIEDPEVRTAVNRKLEQAIAELAEGTLLPVIDHVPTITHNEQDLLPVRQRDQRR